MSKLSALASIYTAGMKAEHLRMKDAVEYHLRSVHDWTDAGLMTLFEEVSKGVLLNTPPPKTCIVCHKVYDGEPAKIVYGQPIHETCVDGVVELLPMFVKEN